MNSSTAKKTQNSQQAQQAIEPVATAKGRTLLMIAFIVIIAAMFAPTYGIMPTILSIGWIFALCLFAAVAMIVLAAKSISQLQGFAGLVFLSVVLREAMGVASVKMIYYQGSDCTLLDRAAEIAAIEGGIAWAISTLATVTAIASATWAGRKIMLRSSNVAVNSIPYKFISTDADKNAGLISEQQADNIKQRITDEARFYLSTAAVSKLLLFDIGISILLILSAATAAAATATESANPADPTLVDPGLVGPGAKVMMITAATLIPSAATIILCAWLVGKKQFELTSTADEQTRNFNIHENDSPSHPDAEILNPDFTEVSQKRLTDRHLDITEDVDLAEFDENELTASPEDTNIEPQQDLAAILGEALEQVRNDDQRPQPEPPLRKQHETSAASKTPDTPDNSQQPVKSDQPAQTDQNNSEDDPAAETGFYEMLAAELRKTPGNETAVLLLGGDSIENMPVTAVVNAGFLLADKQSRCLVIDADIERNAVAQAFDAEPQTDDSPAPCCIDNLLVWTVQPNMKNLGVDIAEKIDSARNNFQSVIIYAPTIHDDAYFGKLAGMINLAVLAPSKAEDSYLNDLQTLLRATDCKCLHLPH